MKKYRVRLTKEARTQLSRHLQYIRNVLKNVQAAKAVRDDVRETQKVLSEIADSIKQSDNPRLAKRGIKKIHLRRHNYVMLFRPVKDNTHCPCPSILRLARLLLFLCTASSV